MQSSTKKETAGATVIVFCDDSKHSSDEGDWHFVNRSDSDDDSIEILEEPATESKETESNDKGESETLSPDFYVKVAKILSPSTTPPQCASGLALPNTKSEVVNTQATESYNSGIEFIRSRTLLPNYDEIARIVLSSSNAPASGSSLALQTPDVDVQDTDSDDSSMEFIQPGRPYSYLFDEIIPLSNLEFEDEVVDSESSEFEDEDIEEEIDDDEIQSAAPTNRFKLCRTSKMNENERIVASGTSYKIFYSFFVGILASLIIQQYKNCIPNRVFDALFNFNLNATDLSDLPFTFSHPNSLAHQFSSSNYSSETADDEDFLTRLRNDIEKRKTDSDRIFEQQLNLLKHVQPWNEDIFVLNFSEFMLQSTQENCTSQPDTPFESCDTNITSDQLPLICQNDDVILVYLNNDHVISIYNVIQKFWNKTEISIQNSIKEALRTFNKSVEYDDNAEDNFNHSSICSEINDKLIDPKLSDEIDVEDEGINENGIVEIVVRKLEKLFTKDEAEVDVDDSQKVNFLPEEWSQSLATLSENILEKAKDVYGNVKAHVVGVDDSESQIVEQEKRNLFSKKWSQGLTALREQILDNDLVKHFLVKDEVEVVDDGDSKVVDVDVETEEKIDESQFRTEEVRGEEVTGDWLIKLMKGRQELRGKASVTGEWLSKLGKAREKFRQKKNNARTKYEEKMKNFGKWYEKTSKKFKSKLKTHFKKMKHQLKDVSEKVAKKYHDLKIKLKTVFH